MVRFSSDDDGGRCCCKSSGTGLLLLLDNLLLSDNDYIGSYYDVSSNNNTNNNNNISTSQKDNNPKYIEGRPLGRLLVVDDDSDILQFFKIGLQNNGFLVDTFTNPKEALRSFKSNSKDFSLVLSDFRMYELSGIELAKKVKEINPNVKVILITAFEIMDKESVLLHVDGFIQKPVGIKELTDKVLNLLGHEKH
jgi:CheY-like chemotaxis protein